MLPDVVLQILQDGGVEDRLLLQLGAYGAVLHAGNIVLDLHHSNAFQLHLQTLDFLRSNPVRSYTETVIENILRARAQYDFIYIYRLNYLDHRIFRFSREHAVAASAPQVFTLRSQSVQIALALTGRRC